jgi:single-strand DNA-binding protein
MNILTFVGRLGRDAEVRTTGNGTPVANLAIAYNYGRKDEDGKRPTQWVDASLWGDRANSLAEYLVKGQQIAVVLRDVHIRTYDKNDGSQGFSLCGDVSELSLVGGAPQQQGGANDRQQPRGNSSGGGYGARGNSSRGQQQRAQPQQRQQPAGGASGFDDFDDDIPF